MKHSEQDIIDMIRHNTPTTQVDKDHRERLRDQVLEAFDRREQADVPAHTPLFTFKRTTVMKIAASLTFLAAVGIFAVTALTPSKAIAFADVARAILKIENARFEIAATITHADGTTFDDGTIKCVTKLPNLLRTETPEGDRMIIDFAKDKMMILDPKKKAAFMMNEFFLFNENDNQVKNLFGEVQEHLRKAEKGGDFGGIRYEKLGEKQIDGTQAIGFRVLNPDVKLEIEDDEALDFTTLDIWADAKTGGPITLVFTADLEDGSKVTSTFKNFVYNQELDPKLFAFEAPEGYKLLNANELGDLLQIGQILGDEGEVGEGVAEANKQAEKLADDAEKNIEALVKDLNNQRPTRDDVIDALRAYTRQTGGQLPDTLESGEMIDAMLEAWEKNNPDKELFNENLSVADEQLNQGMKTILQASTYLSTLEGSGGNYTYRGKGVSVDDKRTPILWLRSKGAPAYRVIYNDFSVADTNRGPEER